MMTSEGSKVDMGDMMLEDEFQPDTGQERTQVLIIKPEEILADAADADPLVEKVIHINTK